MIVCWFEIDDLMCVWFLFFSLTSDVSTFQKNDYCKDHLMNELTDSKEQKDRLLTEYRLISTNKKIDYWLNVEDWRKEIDNWFVDRVFIFHHDWLIDFQNTKNRQLSRFVDLKMLYVNFSFNSRKFVLWLRDSFRELELKVKWNTFIVFKEKTSHIDDFLLTRVSLRMIWNFQIDDFL